MFVLHSERIELMSSVALTGRRGAGFLAVLDDDDDGKWSAMDGGGKDDDSPKAFG